MHQFFHTISVQSVCPMFFMEIMMLFSNPSTIIALYLNLLDLGLVCLAPLVNSWYIMTEKAYSISGEKLPPVMHRKYKEQEQFKNKKCRETWSRAESLRTCLDLNRRAMALPRGNFQSDSGGKGLKTSHTSKNHRRHHEKSKRLNSGKLITGDIRCSQG